MNNNNGKCVGGGPTSDTKHRRSQEERADEAGSKRMGIGQGLISTREKNIGRLVWVGRDNS